LRIRLLMLCSKIKCLFMCREPHTTSVILQQESLFSSPRLNHLINSEHLRLIDKLHPLSHILLLFCAGGYAARSLAIMTDAAHLLTDVGSIGISIFSLWISSRPHTHTMTFGWHRAEILGMLLSVVSIWAVTAVLVITAIQRITDGDYDIDSQIMLLTSGCAVGANVLMVLILHQSGASHGHSHSFPSSRLQTDNQRQGHGHHHSHGNGSVKAAFIHVVGDLVQSVGVLLAATIIHFWPEYKAADPICTFLFSVLVLGTTLPVTKEVFRILMEGVPQGVTFSTVRELLLSVRGVVGVHSLHMWSLNMTHSLLSVHVATDADSQIVLRKATKLLRSEFGFSSVTIQQQDWMRTVETDNSSAGLLLNSLWLHWYN
uniref:Probable proton-coupled zinc antiporter SLC30A3 n=1 Tax=Sander lucioperca TaxID=283035 RepID=A0A8C9Z8N8_SANLU